MSTTWRTLTLVAAVGAAMNAGVFFTFSTFTMNGLKRLRPSEGAAAMQAINKEAPTPPLMALMFGTGVLCLVLGIRAVRVGGDVSSTYQAAAAGIYLVGVIVMTAVYHVPRNNRLDAVDASSAEGVAYWARYVQQWVPMNHVRMVAPIATAVLLAISASAD